MSASACPVQQAAKWLATNPINFKRPIHEQLVERFAITPQQATEAIREANLIRARAH